MDLPFSTTPVVITRDQLVTVDNLDNGDVTSNVTEVENNATMTSPPTGITTDSLPEVISSTLEPQYSSTQPSTTTVTAPNRQQCPDLLRDVTQTGQDGQSVNITSILPRAEAATGPGIPIVITTGERIPGTIVRARCSSGYLPSAITYLECQHGGLWNGSLPVCHAIPSSLSANTLYFAVIGGVCGLSLLVLAVLYCHLLRSRKKKESPMPPNFDPDRAIYVDPYAIGERLYAAPAPLHYARSDITYAKPKIYSTYLNPSFYEDAYDRWRRQEQQVAEKLYDSPWLRPRNSQHRTDNPDFRWNQTSVKARGDTKDYDRFRRLPRAQLSIDQTSIKSTDSFGQVPGLSRSRNAYGRQGSVMSSHSIQFQNMNNPEPPIGHLVKAFDEAPPPPLPPIERMDMRGDGRTQF